MTENPFVQGFELFLQTKFTSVVKSRNVTMINGVNRQIFALSLNFKYRDDRQIVVVDKVKW